MGVVLETEALEYWVDRAGGGRAGGGRAGLVFDKPLANALAAGSVEYWVLSWRRGLWSTGCSPLETEAVEQWVGLAVARAGGGRSGGRSSGGRAGGSGF